MQHGDTGDEDHVLRIQSALNNLRIARPKQTAAEAKLAEGRRKDLAARRAERDKAEKDRKQKLLREKLARDEEQNADLRASKHSEKLKFEEEEKKKRMGLDDQGQPCDPDLAEMILATRTGTGDMEGQSEFLVRWEFGTGKINAQGLPVDRSWVPGALLEATPSSAMLIQDFLAEQSKSRDSAAGVTLAEAEVSIHFHALKDASKALERKRTKIVTVEASKLWDTYRAPLQVISNPALSSA